MFSGAMVLAHSLRDSGTRKQLAILVTVDSIAGSTIEELKARANYNEVLIQALTNGNRKYTTT